MLRQLLVNTSSAMGITFIAGYIGRQKWEVGNNCLSPHCLRGNLLTRNLLETVHSNSHPHFTAIILLLIVKPCCAYSHYIALVCVDGRFIVRLSDHMRVVHSSVLSFTLIKFRILPWCCYYQLMQNEFIFSSHNVILVCFSISV